MGNQSWRNLPTCVADDCRFRNLQISALRSTDVRVIGGAGAGVRAAVAAAEQGVKVILASKFPAGEESNTAIIAGWFTCATEVPDKMPQLQE